ncbi:MAG: pentapeptide repeat-containing protein [Cyanobacteria bacterium P01_G01_bin.38]
MKGSKLLQLYASGRRNFSGEQLQGQSLRGQNLTGIDLRGADLRGVNFIGANLTGANLQGAKAGLPIHWGVIWGVIACLLAAVAGFLSGYVGDLVTLLLISERPGSVSAGWVTLFVQGVFFAIALYRNLAVGFKAVALTLAVSITATIAAALLLAATGDVSSLFPEAFYVVFSFAIAASLTVAVAFVLAVAVVLASIVAGAVAVVMAISTAVAVAIGAVFAVAVALTVVIQATVAIAIAMVVIGLSTYLGGRTLAGAPNHHLIQSMAVTLAAIGGTCFRRANLTDADFTQAYLKSTDLRRAHLIRTRWRGTQALSLARVGDSYLQYPVIRDLVITGQGKDLTVHPHPLNLQGINLAGANLVNANFTGAILKDGTLQGANLADATLTLANLNRVNLQDADCSRAKLVQTQLHETSLAGACLTGATIEDWGITTATQLNGLQCDYVFMRLPRDDDPDANPHRKPDAWDTNFEPGEFIDFISPLIDTLDLYHNQTVDPRVVAVAFNELRENNPDSNLEIISMERRGKRRDKFLLRAEARPQSNLAELHAQYFDRYRELLALPPQTLVAILMEKESQTTLLANMVSTAVNRSGIYAKNYQHQGGTMSTPPLSPPTVNQTFQGPVSGVAGNVQGDQIVQAPERQSLADAAVQIQQLLQQLAKTNPTATETDQKAFVGAALPPTTKQRLAKALRQGGKTALAELLDNVYVNVAVAAIEGWSGD